MNLSEIVEHIQASFKFLFYSKHLLLFMTVVFFAEWAIDGVERFYQPFLAKESINASYISYIYSFSALVGIVFLLIENKVSKKLNIGELNILVFAKIIIITVIAVSVILSGWASYLCIFIFFAVKCLITPSAQSYLNRLVPSSSRATCLSIYNFAGAVGEVFAGLTIGVAAQYLGVAKAILISAFCLIPAVIALVILRQSD